MKPYDKYLSRHPDQMNQRVDLILEAVTRSVHQQPEEDGNQANIRRMEAFISFLRAHFPADRFNVVVQILPEKKVRTTDRNFIVVVPGRSRRQIVMVAHYDTWAGFSKTAPGADDNTTGEEVLKQYLLQDLCSEIKPPLTHVYLFSGSEECGTRGLLSQFALVVGLYIIGYALAAQSWLYFALAFLFLPFAVYRFGITGTRHYVESLSKETKNLINAAIAVDSVGEGRLYILENEMGANFIRALFPYEGSERLNDILEEGAHLNGIKYNQFLAGGTTDSVAFLEERRFPGSRINTRIPAAAVLTMAPGKASPFVFGGKLHTQKDTPDRVYPEPIQETLTVIDYARQILHGVERPYCPRSLSEHHYARLYRQGKDLFLIAKDAVEPNRRNINTIFRVKGDIQDREAGLALVEMVWWGVETTLDKEIKDFRPGAKRIAVDGLTIEEDHTRVHFAKISGVGRRIKAVASWLLGNFQRLIGRYSLAAMFLTCFLVAHAGNGLLDLSFAISHATTRFMINHMLWVFAIVWVLQILLLLRLFTRELPAAMDNAYKHRNRADNLFSLRRARQ